MASTWLAIRLARRELRGGLKGFRVFLACLALGVAAIAGIGSLSSAIVAGMRADVRSMVGGDVEIRATGQGLADDAQRYLDDNTVRQSKVRTLNAMVRNGAGDRTLVQLKGVDAAYPLFGEIPLEPAMTLAEALAPRDGLSGAVAEAELMNRLGLQPGDVLVLGEARFHLSARLVKEPDRVINALSLGPRLMVADSALEGTGLVRLGSLVGYRSRVELAPGADVGTWVRDLGAAFPDAGWRVRDVRNAQPSVKRFVDRFGMFLTLVGLTALVIGGIGVGNGVKSYLDGKTRIIAMLKCIGAPGSLIFRIYLAQVMMLAAIAIAIGLAVGAAVPFALSGTIGDALPVPARFGLYPLPLLLAAVYGVLTALVFTLWPLAQAREVSAAGLFRAIVAPAMRMPRPRYLVAMVVATLVLAGLAVVSGEQPFLARWFVLGALASLILLRLAASAVTWAVSKLPRPRRTALRLAVSNLSRPGAGTGNVVVSLGAGLTVLVAVALIDGNLVREIQERVPDKAPSFFFIDIQPGQVQDFEATVRNVPGAGELVRVPTLRGRLIRVNGRPVAEVPVDPHEAWVTRSEIGFTYAADQPANAELTEGSWWPADYRGEPLISLDREIAKGFGIGIGDRLTFNILGRAIEARIHNLRIVDWSQFGLNFVVIFAPGTLEGAPHAHVASAQVPADQETNLYQAVTSTFANISAIKVREILETIQDILGRLSLAIRSTAGLAILSGVLVLAGAVAAGFRRRLYDAVILKVLGATRGDVARAYLLEYALLGLVTGAIACGIGWVTAYMVITEVMQGVWTPLPGTMLAIVAGAVAATVVVGLGGTWSALSQKVAPILRVD